MWHSHLVAALRNLARHQLYAAINIAGLAIGFAAAISIALFVRDEFSYERFIPGHENIHLIRELNDDGAGEWREHATVPPAIMDWLRASFPEVQAAARLTTTTIGVRNGNIEAIERIREADAQFFTVIPRPVVAGNTEGALERPESVVLTRSVARKYFDRDDPVGQTLIFGGVHHMTVAAVIEDWPSNSHLSDAAILVSSRAPFSRLHALDSTRGKQERFEPLIAATYVRLAPGTAIDPMRARPECAKPGACDRQYKTLPIADVHLHQFGSTRSKSMNPRRTIRAMCVLGVLILAVSCINFVNLTTARATQRATEVGVRKVSGASRADLTAQFLGESLLYTGMSTVAAIGLVELMLPAINGFLDRTLVFDYWRDLRFTAGMLAAAATVGLLSGIYPALVLSSFHPTTVFRGVLTQGGGSGFVRRALVVAQFAILTGLILATTVIYKQSRYAMNEGTRVDKDQVLLIALGDAGCQSAFNERLTRIPGVLMAACSLNAPLGNGISIDTPARDGKLIRLRQSIVDFDYFRLYGIAPLAGRLFDRRYATDAAPADRNSPQQPSILLNETGSRALGFASPAEAVGQTIPFPRFLALDGRVMSGQLPAPVIGVIPDFPLGSVRGPVEPTAFFIDPVVSLNLSVKLSGARIPETLQAIDRLWKDMGRSSPLQREFFDDRMQRMYQDVMRQIRIMGVAAGLTLLLACLGLFGLSAFIAERRTREIGIRKSLGAGSYDVAKLLLRQFSAPVLWSCLIAWPLGYYAMQRWLQGFAYHIDLTPWMFLGASALALAIALLTVSVHLYTVARARPVKALRYE